MSFEMLSTNLAGSKKLSGILPDRNLAKRILRLAGWVAAENTTLRSLSPGRSRAGQLGTAQEETTIKTLLNQMEILKKSQKLIRRICIFSFPCKIRPYSPLCLFSAHI